ncbi:hypothetical protein IAQ61_002564 [Plenodomus lingam]|uniref:Predicted protein n=1 Tax=Leptosphaeria maculans (strain JN3 / isolate v23.1.3 / race Av1-4-5-6-7-8) TaxID=985895 RepID=E4ZIT3_LEPMJ|nr:predicted protein [Plenodomus lingam JN3]KAH9877201.1 hypothetical protein IAQ61_002564 [Plenodomus lingam]CBX91104.1 predicted protein [Plenodomus lingam JN3]
MPSVASRGLKLQAGVCEAEDHVFSGAKLAPFVASLANNPWNFDTKKPSPDAWLWVTAEPLL